MTRQGFICALCLLAGPTITATATAAEWTIEPTLRFGGGYNDNVTLRPDDQVSSPEIDFNPSVRFGVETPRSGLHGNLALDLRRFTEESDLNDNNVRFTVTSYHRLEKAEFGLGASLIKDTSLDSQLEETGLVFDRVNRLQRRLSPRWSWNFDERTRLALNYTYTDVDYSNRENTAFLEFNSNSGQITLTRVLGERTLATLTMSQIRSSNESDVDSTVSSLQGGVSYNFSETVRGSLSVGRRRSKSEFNNSAIPIFAGGLFLGFITEPGRSESSSSGYVFNASLSKRLERAEIGLSASRNITNAASGFLTEVTRLGWNNRYRFARTVACSLNMSASRSRTTDDSSVTTSLDRDYYQVVPACDWNFTPLWRISGGYRYSRQTFGDSNDDAIRNVAYLTLTYRWPRIAVSR